MFSVENEETAFLFNTFNFEIISLLVYVAQVPLGEQPVDIIQHIVSSVFRNGLQDGDWHVINPDTESFSTPTSQTMSYANTRTTPGAVTGPEAPLATADPALEEAFFGAPQISISDESENESDEADETSPTISFDQQLRFSKLNLVGVNPHTSYITN